MSIARSRSMNVISQALIFIFIFSIQSVAESQTTLEIWTHALSRLNADDESSPGGVILKRYMEQNPHVKINVLPVSYSQIEEKLVLAIATGIVPDLILMETKTSIRFILDNYIARIPDHLMFELLDLGMDPRLRRTVEFEGAVYGIPFMTDEYAFTWNKTHFDESGLDRETPPQTWDDLIEFAQRLTRRGGEGNLLRSGYPILLTGTTGTIDKWLSYLWSAGGDTITPSDTIVGGEPGFNNDAGQMAAQLYHDLIHIHQVYDPGFGDPRALFRSERASMQYSEYRAITGYAHELPHIDYGLALPPPPGGKDAVVQGYFGYALHPIKSSDNLDIALDLIRFFMLPENDLTRAVLLGAQPYNVNNYSSPEWQEIPGIGEFIPVALEYARPITMNRMGTQVGDVLGRLLTEAWRGRISIETALEEAERMAGSILNEDLQRYLEEENPR